MYHKEDTYFASDLFALLFFPMLNSLRSSPNFGSMVVNRHSMDSKESALEGVLEPKGVTSP